MLKVMVLGIVRDRGAFTMAFVLPPAIFIIFAAIFSGASGDEMRLSVAVVDAVQSSESRGLVSALRGEPALRVQSSSVDESEVRAEVSSGVVDVGLVIRGSLIDETSTSPIVVFADAGRAMAGPIVAGHVQRLIASELPGVSLRRTVPEIETLTGGLSDEQQGRLAAGLDALDAAEGGAESSSSESPTALVAIETMSGGTRSNPEVSYYAGAIAIMFLLLSAMQGATSLIEERTSGILDRLAVGPAGTDVVVASKFLFLTLQGICQVGLIFLVAWLAYGVDLAERFGPWLVVTTLASAAAAGLALAIAATFTTKQQATTISAFLVLLASAIGGSMVPRFMMPPWLQDIGWFTPNAWAIEAYQGIMWRGQSLGDLLPSLSVLAAVALIGFVAALGLARYRLRLT